ncbi:unnamed protein product, partial [Protopolystoma xenopodis]
MFERACNEVIRLNGEDIGEDFSLPSPLQAMPTEEPPAPESQPETFSSDCPRDEEDVCQEGPQQPGKPILGVEKTKELKISIAEDDKRAPLIDPSSSDLFAAKTFSPLSLSTVSITPASQIVEEEMVFRPIDN